MRRLIRRFFAPDGGQGGSGAQQQDSGRQPADEQEADKQNSPAFDYEKLASIVAGKQTVAEDAVLKSYFKQQGLSEEEMKQAVKVFKQQKAAAQPDVSAMQEEIAKVRAQAAQSAIENAAIMEAVGLGLDSKTIPYVLKMAELSAVTGQDGKIDKEKLKGAITKVLEDVPQLKPVTEGNKGFQIGGNGDQQNQDQQKQNNLNQMPTRRWNRFNN